MANIKLLSLEQTDWEQFPDELEQWIKEEYLSLSGKVLTDKYMDFAVIKQFAHGGMSSGGVDNRWWMEKGIPLLMSRLAAL